MNLPSLSKSAKRLVNLGIYKESKHYPGYPINRTYTKNVKKFLAENQYKLDTP
jgi:hypothetical protein